MNTLPTTIEECYQVIRLLLAKVEELSIRLDGLEAENKKLKMENAQLKERLNINSSNSSLSPSKSFKKKTNKRQSSGKKSGGQMGQAGHYRELLPSDKVDSIENCQLPKSCLCGGEITPSKGFVRHQVYELPVLKLHVTEYQLQKGSCATCGQKHCAPLPAGVTWGLTGPRLTAFMSDLVAKYGLSRREQQAFLCEHFQFNISLGTVFNKQKIVNAAMEAPVAELLPIVKANNNVYSDETSHVYSYPSRSQFLKKWITISYQVDRWY